MPQNRCLHAQRPDKRDQHDPSRQSPTVARFIRFIVHHRIKRAPRNSGLFTAAYALHKGEELTPHDQERLEQLLKWFATGLPVPPSGSIPSGAIFWYNDVGPFSQRMWDLVHLLSEYGIISEMIAAGFIGKVVYQNKHQVAAIPRNTRTRSR
jgi:hypothetical protein